MDGQSQDMCSSCALEVRKLQQRLTCSHCKDIFHRICIKDLSQAIYRNWKRDGLLAEWRCSNCVEVPSIHLPGECIDLSSIPFPANPSHQDRVSQINGNTLANSLPSTQLNENSSSTSGLPSNTDEISVSAPRPPSNTDVISTCAPRPPSNTDVISTCAPRPSSNTDVISTCAPRLPSNTDVISTRAPRPPSNTDVISTCAPRPSSNTDVISTCAPRPPSNTDVISTRAPRPPSNTDVISSCAQKPPSNTDWISQQLGEVPAYGCCDIHKASPSVVEKKDSRRVTSWPYYEVVDEPVRYQAVAYHKSINDKTIFINLRKPSEKDTSGTKIWLGFRPGAHVKETHLAMSQPGRVLVNGKALSQKLDLTKKGFVNEPIDITDYCNRRSSNKIRFINHGDKFYLSDFFWWIHEVQNFSVESLCKKLEKQRLMHPDHTTTLVKSLFVGDEESDIAATSIHASLVCPIGKTRLRHPCRGKSCTHVQCVDALTMVSLNAKKCHWSCQVCSKPCPYEELVIDGLFMEILKAVPDTVTEVEFREDGSWTYKGEKLQETTTDKENDFSIIELDLSRNLEMIDLTETDDEKSPVCKKPEKMKSKAPLKTNTILINTASETAGEKLGQNYQHSNLTNCHRNKENNHNNQQDRRPYNRHDSSSNNPAVRRIQNDYNTSNRYYNSGFNSRWSSNNRYNQQAHSRWSDRAQIQVRRAITSIADYFSNDRIVYAQHADYYRTDRDENAQNTDYYRTDYAWNADTRPVWR